MGDGSISWLLQTGRYHLMFLFHGICFQINVNLVAFCLSKNSIGFSASASIVVLVWQPFKQIQSMQRRNVGPNVIVVLKNVLY